MSEIVKKSNVGYKRLIVPVLAALLGILLLWLGSVAAKEKTDESEKSVQNDPSSMSAEEFAAMTEEKIVAICSEVAGVGEVRAVVTLGGGYRAVYASDSQNSGTSYRSETVLKGSGSSEQAILVGYETPKITGIGIVCTGGDDPTIRQRIVSLVSAAFDISSHKIYVVGSAETE